MLIIPKSAVQKALDIRELIPLVEYALTEFSMGKCIQPEKRGIDLGIQTGLMEIFTAYLTQKRVMSVKILNSRKANPASGRPLIYAHITLVDPDTGESLALIEGGSVTASRTAAASAVATRYLSRHDSSRLALIGTGRQGRTHLEALLTVRQIKHVCVYNRHRDSAEKFRSECEEKYNIDISIGTTVEETVRNADIIQLCTTTTEPVLLGPWVKPGTHVNSIASYAPGVREADTDLVLKSKVVTDNRQEALTGAGELVIALAEGLITPDYLHAEIGEIAAGVKPGREKEDEITFFKSMGIAAEDAVVAQYIYRKARDEGFGTEMNLED